ncbi:hypothetical protein Bca101_079235 [Brassica carinata]
MKEQVSSTFSLLRVALMHVLPSEAIQVSREDIFGNLLTIKVIAVLTGHCHANCVLFATTSDAVKPHNTYNKVISPEALREMYRTLESRETGQQRETS